MGLGIEFGFRFGLGYLSLGLGLSLGSGSRQSKDWPNNLNVKFSNSVLEIASETYLQQIGNGARSFSRVDTYG